MQKIAFGRSDVSVALTRMNPGDWQMQTVQVGPWHLGAVTHPTPVTALTGWTGIIMLGEDRAIIAGRPLIDIGKISSGAALIAALKTADGVFAAAIWTAASQQFEIISDFLGLQPLYQSGDTYASEMKAYSGAPCAAGWAGFAHFGHVFGSDTLLDGVRRVDAGHGHYVWPQQLRRSDAGEIAELFRASVSGNAALVPKSSTLLLSGGYDSRLVAAAFDRDVQVRARIFSHSDELGDADARLAQRVARRLGLTYDVIAQKQPNRLAAFAWSVDASFPTHGLFIGALHHELPTEPVWDGLVPNVSVRLIQSQSGFAAYARKHDSGSIPKIFMPSWQADIDAACESALVRSWAHLPQDDFGLTQWIFENRTRRRTSINPLQAHAQKTLALLPGVSRSFWTAVQGIDHASRMNWHFAHEVMAQLDPALAQIPYASGGILRSADGRGLHRLTLRAHLAQLLGERPRLQKLVGWPPLPPIQDVFASPALYDEDDPYLDMDVVQQLKTTGTMTEKRLLLHWRMNRWLHDGRLLEMMGR